MLAAQLDHSRQATGLSRFGTFGTLRAQYQAVELPEADVTGVAMWFINGYVDTQTLTLRILGAVPDATFPSGWAPDSSNIVGTSEPLYLPGDHTTIPDQEYIFSFATPVHLAAGVYFLAPQIDSSATVAAYGSAADLVFGKCMRGSLSEIARMACEGNGGDVEDLYYRVLATAPPATECEGVPATIVGTSASETINGTPADDVIHGLGGGDFILGFDGNDRICGGDGADDLRGGPGNDVVFGEAGIDNVFGLEGSDELHGGAETDNMTGDSGDDLIDGGSGFDTGNFSAAPGAITASLATGTASGDGNDTLANIEWLAGSRFADILTGDADDNRLEGLGGDDTLDGAAGFDSLRGGEGIDTCLNGEANVDCEIFPPSRSDGADIAAALAPVVYLHPDEIHWPLSPERFVDNSALAWSHDAACFDTVHAERGAVDARRLGDGRYSDRPRTELSCRPEGPRFRSNRHTRPYDFRPFLRTTKEGFYLDLDDTLRAGTSSTHPTPGTFYTGTPVYYDYLSRRFITYWFAYGFSVPTWAAGFGHEGDWEHISIRLDARDRPTHVAYYFHNEPPLIMMWESAARAGDHVHAYSARHGHASYPTAGIQASACLVFSAVLCGPDETARGPVWLTWLDLRKVDDEPWYGFGGAWGAVGEFSATTGGLPPSRHKPRAPCVFTRGVQPCD